MDNDQRQSWWPDEHSSNSHPAPRKESPLPEENLTEQHQEQQQRLNRLDAFEQQGSGRMQKGQAAIQNIRTCPGKH